MLRGTNKTLRLFLGSRYKRQVSWSLGGDTKSCGFLGQACSWEGYQGGPWERFPPCLECALCPGLDLDSVGTVMFRAMLGRLAGLSGPLFSSWDQPRGPQARVRCKLQRFLGRADAGREAA